MSELAGSMRSRLSSLVFATGRRMSTTIPIQSVQRRHRPRTTMATDTSSAAASAPGVLSDRTLAFAATPCFRVDVREHERPRIPGEAVQGHIRISRRLLVLSTATATNSSGGGGGSSKGYHAIDVSLMAEAKIRASVQMPQGNVVPTFEKIVLWKTPAQSLLSLANDNLKDDELGLVSVPFSIQLPPTVPALSTSPFHKDSKTASSEVIQVAPLPTCSLPPGLQIAVSVVVAARRTSSIVNGRAKTPSRCPSCFTGSQMPSFCDGYRLLLTRRATNCVSMDASGPPRPRSSHSNKRCLIAVGSG